MNHLPGPVPSPSGVPPAGVLMTHGFAAAQPGLRPCGDHFAAAGYPVVFPSPPGHEPRGRRRSGAHWSDWYEALEEAWLELQPRCEVVFGMGMATGAALMLRLAARHPRTLAGVILVNPVVSGRRDRRSLFARTGTARPLGFADGVATRPRRMRQRDPGMPVRTALGRAQLWKGVRADVASVTVPTMLFRSREDHVAETRSADLIRAGLGNAAMTERVLENSRDRATLDHDAEWVFTEADTWIKAHTGVAF